MEDYPEPVTKNITQKILDQMNNSFYVIKQNNKNYNIGCFSHIKNDNEIFPVLIINNYLKNKDLKNTRVIKINNKEENIELTDIIYKNQKHNITIVVIKENNNDIKYIDMDEGLFENEYEVNFCKESIYAIQYNYDMKDIQVSYGMINNNDDNEFFYSANIKSEYSFIFNLSNNKLIGIHENKSKYYNKGIFFNYIINELFDEYKNRYFRYFLRKRSPPPESINEIIISMDISEEEVNKKEKINFIGNYEFKDRKGNSHFNNNLKDLKILELKINDMNKLENERSFIPEKAGEIIIKIKYENNIKDYSHFFAGCNKITKINFKSFNNKDIIDMKYMFYGCDNLKEINSFTIDTQKVTDMSYMFYGCNSLNILDLSSFDTKNVTNMSEMFYHCKILPDISKWDTQNVTNMSGMFRYCEKLEELPDIANWNTGNVIDMSLLFCGCKTLEKLPDISKWDTYNVSNFSSMFWECNKLKILPDISRWNTKNVTNMSEMFYSCESLEKLPNISKWDIQKVTDKSGMFDYCDLLKYIPEKFKK